MTLAFLPYKNYKMKKIIAIFAMLFLAAFLSGCAQDTNLGGKTYQAFGIINDDVYRDPNVKYEVSFGSCLVALIFFETLIIPAYVIGWDLYQPVAIKQ
jgi:hypothetical protein